MGQLKDLQSKQGATTDVAVPALTPTTTFVSKPTEKPAASPKPSAPPKPTAPPKLAAPPTPTAPAPPKPAAPAKAAAPPKPAAPPTPVAPPTPAAPPTPVALTKPPTDAAAAAKAKSDAEYGKIADKAIAAYKPPPGWPEGWAWNKVDRDFIAAAEFEAAASKNRLAATEKETAALMARFAPSEATTQAPSAAVTALRADPTVGTPSYLRDKAADFILEEKRKAAQSFYAPVTDKARARRELAQALDAKKPLTPTQQKLAVEPGGPFGRPLTEEEKQAEKGLELSARERQQARENRELERRMAIAREAKAKGVPQTEEEFVKTLGQESPKTFGQELEKVQEGGGWKGEMALVAEGLSDLGAFGRGAETAARYGIAELFGSETAQRAAQAEWAREAAQAQYRREYEEAMRTPVFEAGREIADKILSQEGSVGTAANRFVDLRSKDILLKAGAEKVTSEAQRANMRDAAEKQARRELVALSREGGLYSLLRPEDLLLEQKGESWAEKTGRAVDQWWIPTQTQAAITGAAALLDTELGRAMRPTLRVSESGAITRGESVPGWFMNSVLSLPDYAATTLYENWTEGDFTKKAHTFVENVAARRDPITWAIENDDQIQADIASGDMKRILRAVGQLSPFIATQFISPDSITAAGIAFKGAGIASKAVSTSAEIVAKSGTIARATRAAEKGQRVAAFRGAMLAVLEEAAKSKAIAKAADKVEEAAAAGRTVKRILDKNQGDVAATLKDAEAVEKRSVVRIRDDAKARLYADPDIALFIEAAHGKDKPPSLDLMDIKPEDYSKADKFKRPEAQAAIERGRAKYKDALKNAEEASVSDFLKQAGVGAEEADYARLLETPTDRLGAGMPAGREATRAGATPEEALSAAEAPLTAAAKAEAPASTNIKELELEAGQRRYAVEALREELANGEEYLNEVNKKWFTPKGDKKYAKAFVEDVKERLRVAEAKQLRAEEELAAARKAATTSAEAPPAAPSTTPSVAEPTPATPEVPEPPSAAAPSAKTDVEEAVFKSMEAPSRSIPQLPPVETMEVSDLLNELDTYDALLNRQYFEKYLSKTAASESTVKQLRASVARHRRTAAEKVVASAELRNYRRSLGLAPEEERRIPSVAKVPEEEQKTARKTALWEGRTPESEKGNITSAEADPVLAKMTRVTQAVEFVRDNTKNPFYKALAERLLQVGGRFSEAEFELLQEGTKVRRQVARKFEGWLGLGIGGALGLTESYPKAGQPIKVWLRGGTLGGMGSRSIEEIVLHEALHAATTERLALGVRGAVEGSQLRRATDDFLDLHKLVVEKINERRAQGVATSFEVSDDLLRKLNDPHEFLAYGMSDPEFQAFLATIPTNESVFKVPSLWGRFVNAVRELVGLPKLDASALSKLIGTTDKILDVPEEALTAARKYWTEAEDVPQISLMEEGPVKTPTSATPPPVEGAFIPEVRREDVFPLPVVTEEEKLDRFGKTEISAKDTQTVANATTPKELIGALKQVEDEAVREHVAKKYGFASFADMERVADIDEEAAAKKIAEATAALSRKKQQLQEALAYRAGLEQAAEGKRRYADAALDLTLTDRERSAKERAAAATRKSGLRELQAATAEANALVEQELPAFKPSTKLRDAQASIVAAESRVPEELGEFQFSKEYQDAAKKVQDDQDALDAGGFAAKTRAKKQEIQDRKWEKLAKKEAAERAAHDLKITAREEKLKKVAELKAKHDKLLAEEQAAHAQKVQKHLDKRNAALTKVREAREKWERDVQAADEAARVAEAKYKEAQKKHAVVAKPTARAVGRIPEDAKPHFEYAGEPSYGRGYAIRPPMEYARGNEAHFLNAALLREKEATSKFLSGPDTADFTGRAAKIEHVGAELPHFETAPTEKELYTYRVTQPGTNAPKLYTGEPEQRGWNRQLEWNKAGEKVWSALEKIADKQQDLPRARSLSDYFHSLLPWSDPEAAAADVDLIRLNDEVYAADPTTAKEVGEHMQPPGMTGGPVKKIGNGFTGRVVGFERGAPVIQPLEWSGGGYKDFGTPVRVDPEKLLYKERGRVMKNGERTPMTTDEWKALRAQEDTMAADGARDATMRYKNKDRFTKLAPPERPSSDNFNYNPEKMKHILGAETVEKIKAEMGLEPPQIAEEGARGMAQIKAADDGIAALTKDIAGRENVLSSLQGGVADKQRLIAAVEGQRPALTDMAARIGQREAAPSNRVVIGARSGKADLAAELESIDRHLNLASQNMFQRGVQRVYDLIQPAGELERRSLLNAGQAALRRVYGDGREISAELALAAQAIDATSKTPNARAMSIVENYGSAFQAAVLAKKANPTLLSLVATAYARNAEDLPTDALKTLVAEVVDWAKTGDGPDKLRERLINKTSMLLNPSNMRFAQEGDVMLAQASALQGAWYNTINSEGLRGVVLPAEDALQVNSYLDGLTGTGTSVGGRAGASRGRQIVADIMVPEAYAPPVGKLGVDIEAQRAKPFVPAFGQSGVPKSELAKARQAVVAEVAGIMEEAERVANEQIYVPRPIREAFAKQISNALESAKIQGTKDALFSINFWKQAYVLGLLTSEPRQFLMDYYGDISQIIAAGHPIIAARVAARSAVAQALGIPGVAQAGLLSEALARAMAGRDVVGGDAARAFVSATSFTKDIDAIHKASPDVQLSLPKFNGSAEELHRIAAEHGVFEDFWTGQLGNVLSQKASELHGNAPFRKYNQAINANSRALQACVNVAATRRRLSLMYTFMEDGLTAEQAAAKTVSILGDFSTELHPIERSFLSWFFPFLSYRKYAVRRSLKTLASPYWWTRQVKAGEGVAALASWLFDDSDEFGMHTNAMEEEPDPAVLFQIRKQISNEYPGIDPDSKEAAELAFAKAKRLHEQDPNAVPMASVRYQRFIERARKMAKEVGFDEAKRRLLNGEDEDFNILSAYYAPDPVKDNLPTWAQDRLAIWNQEHRSQKTATWFKDKPDQQRYTLLPMDPITSGIGDFVGMASSADFVYNVFRGLADPIGTSEFVSPGAFGQPGAAGLAGITQNPVVATVLRAAQVPVEGRKRYIPNDIGEILYGRGLADKDITMVPTTEGANASIISQPGERYYIPAATTDALLLFPPVANVVLGLADVYQTGQEISGSPLKPQAPSSFTSAATTAGALTGLQTSFVSPRQQETIAKGQFARRLEEATPREQMELPLSAEEERARTLSKYGMGGKEAIQRHMQAALLDVYKNRDVDPAFGMNALRVLLRSMGIPPEEVNRMESRDVLLKVNELVRDPAKYADLDQAIANPSIPE